MAGDGVESAKGSSTLPMGMEGVLLVADIIVAVAAITRCCIVDQDIQALPHFKCVCLLFVQTKTASTGNYPNGL